MTAVGARALASASDVNRFFRAKFLWIDFHLGVAVAWSLLPTSELLATRTIVLAGISWFVVVAACTAGLALDDGRGALDGTDERNYLASDATGLRPLARKPLLSGAVAPDADRRIAVVTGGASLLVGVTTFLVAGAQPWWLLPLALIVFGIVVQYSVGLRFSYRFLFGGALVIWVAAAGACVVPYALLSSGLDGTVVIQAALVGLWFAVVSGLSNTYDKDGDRLAGRRTVAATLSARSNHAYLLTLVVVPWVLSVAASVLGWLQPWTLLVVAVVGVLQIIQLRLAGRTSAGVLRARRLGFQTIGLAVVLLVASNVLLQR